jgi:hypothetical protein
MALPMPVEDQRPLLHIGLGSLDDAPSVRPQAHMFVASKAAWHDIGSDGLRQFEGMPPR